MPSLSLLAKLGLDKTGFDAGLDSATRSAETFGTKLTKKIGQAFGAAAVIAAARKIGSIINEIADDSAKLNKEFENVGGALTPKDIEILKQYADEWDRFGSKLRYVGAQIGIIVGQEHQRAAGIFDRVGSFIGGAADFILQRKTGKEVASDLGQIGARKRQHEGTDLVFGRNESNEALFDSAREKRKADIIKASEIHQTIQERIVELEKQSAAINEKTRFSKLTDAQKLNDLLKQRNELELLLSRRFSLEGEDTQGEAFFIRNKRLAEVNSEIAGLKSRSDFPTISNDAGKIGAFSGASGSASLPGLARQQVYELNRVYELLRNGIPITDVKR